jgi:hypothetical protein
MIDIIKIYKKYNIKYYTEGKNVSQNWINIQCPCCSDKSWHLGFNSEKQYYYCWKCQYHSIKEIFTKLKIPLSELKNNTQSIILNKLNNKEIIKKDFILPGTKLNDNHKNYLLNRDFDANYLENKYKLLGTNHLDQKYKFRIIIPIIYNNQIVSFTSRDYTNKQTLRYISCPKEMEIIEHKNILFNYDNCQNSFIIIVEGIFDCFRMDDNCCATFGISYTKEQVNLLTKYETIYICFDNEIDAQKQAEKLGNELSGIGKNVFIVNIPDQYKDMAEMPEAEAMKFKQELLNDK